MKKFTKSIEICPDNILEALNCPIVKGVRKVANGINNIGGRGDSYTVDTVLLLDVSGFELPFNFTLGSVLALDVCGTWYAFTRKEWNEHKNDEI